MEFWFRSNMRFDRCNLYRHWFGAVEHRWHYLLCEHGSLHDSIADAFQRFKDNESLIFHRFWWLVIHRNNYIMLRKYWFKVFKFIFSVRLDCSVFDFTSTNGDIGSRSRELVSHPHINSWFSVYATADKLWWTEKCFQLITLTAPLSNLLMSIRLSGSNFHNWIKIFIKAIKEIKFSVFLEKFFILLKFFILAEEKLWRRKIYSIKNYPKRKAKREENFPWQVEQNIIRSL